MYVAQMGFAPQSVPREPLDSLDLPVWTMPHEPNSAATHPHTASSQSEVVSPGQMRELRLAAFESLGRDTLLVDMIPARAGFCPGVSVEKMHCFKVIDMADPRKVVFDCLLVFRSRSIIVHPFFPFPVWAVQEPQG